MKLNCLSSEGASAGLTADVSRKMRKALERENKGVVRLLRARIKLISQCSGSFWADRGKGRQSPNDLLPLPLQTLEASRAPHRSLFEGKWRKMSKKWERRTFAAPSAAAAVSASAAHEKRELSDMGEHIFHVSRRKECAWRRRRRRWRVLALSSGPRALQGGRKGKGERDNWRPRRRRSNQCLRGMRHSSGQKRSVTRFHHRVTDVDLERINQKSLLSLSSLCWRRRVTLASLRRCEERDCR